VQQRLKALRAQDIFLASDAHGVPQWRLLCVHGLLAGCGRLVARHGIRCMGFATVVESTLSYIGGFGVQEPLPSWGNMLAFEWGWSAAALLPAVAIWMTLMAIMGTADALAEVRHG
jgi:ABC-type dipeptide/oligopeptide/nickel transport system permease subunit